MFACMLQRAVLTPRPFSRCYAGINRAVKLRRLVTAVTPLGLSGQASYCFSPHHFRFQSMPPATQVRRSSRNISTLVETDTSMPAGISAFSVPEAAAAPVCNATTTDAGRKRKRSKQKADAIAVKSEELEPLPVLQSATGYPATGTDHSVPEPASSQQGGITDAKALVKLETTAAAEVLHHTVPETSTQAPAKARKVKQTKAKATLIKKQSQSEKPHADLNVSTAAHAVTDDANQASTHKSKQATSKAAVKQEPAELDQPANTALNTAAAASPAAVPAADKPASGRNKNKTKAVIKDEPAELDQQADAAATAVADGPLTDAHEAAPAAAPARKPRKPRAKAAVKVDIAEVIASLDLKPYRDRVKPRKWVGAHVSMAAGLERAVVRAAAIGANAFAMDTRSKRRWDSPPIDVDRAAAFRQACKEFGFGPQHILPHGSYLINLATADPEMYVKSYNAFVDELQRCETLGLGLYNFHPGSTCGLCPAEEGMDRIADAINRAHAETTSVVIVLENMAGAGHSVGHKFEYLSYIIDKVHNKQRVGVCLDTCHLYAGGYDVSSPEAFEQVMTEFDKEVGLKYLRGMHVNDSKAALGSKKDRHENVAKGLIGQDCFTFIMNDSRFDGIPLIMETPVQCEGPNIDYKLSLLAGAAVFKGPAETETGENTDKRDIAWLNHLVKV